MKLVDLIPLQEIHFGSQDAFNEYIKQHELRPDTKITIRGKAMTVAQATKNSQPATSTSDSSKNKGGSNSSKKVEDLVKNLSGKKYKEFAFDNDIDPNDANEMQDFISSLSDKDAQDILKKYGTN